MRLPQAPLYTDHERLVLDAVTQRAHPFWEATKSEFAEAVGLPSGVAEAALHKLVAEVRVGRIAVHSRGSGEWRTPVRRFFRVWNDARVVPFIRPCARCGSMGTHRQGYRLKMFVKPALACPCAKWTDRPAPCGLTRRRGYAVIGLTLIRAISCHAGSSETRLSMRREKSWTSCPRQVSRDQVHSPAVVG